MYFCCNKEDYIYGDDTTYLKRIINTYDELGTFLNLKVGEERANIIGDKVLNKFGDKLEHFGLLNESDKIIV